MNCDDMMVCMEVESMEKSLVELKKRKKLTRASQDKSKAADILQNRQPDPCKWTKTQAKLMIICKAKGEYTQAELQVKNVSDLRTMYINKYKDVPLDRGERWTNADQKRFAQTLSGNYESIDQTGIMQRAYTRRKDYLRDRFKSIPRKHGDEVLEDFVKYRFDSEDDAATFIHSVFNESNQSNEELLSSTMTMYLIILRMMIP